MLIIRPAYEDGLPYRLFRVVHEPRVIINQIPSLDLVLIPGKDKSILIFVAKVPLHLRLFLLDPIFQLVVTV